MYAIIETGGKQYRVAQGDSIRVEKLAHAEGDSVTFDKVLAVSKEGGLTIGTPYVEGAKVIAKVTGEGKGKKIRVFKYKAKKNYRRRQGHRQPFTQLVIEAIEA